MYLKKKEKLNEKKTRKFEMKYKKVNMEREKKENFLFIYLY